jgi:hypothetical protein
MRRGGGDCGDRGASRRGWLRGWVGVREGPAATASGHHEGAVYGGGRVSWRGRHSRSGGRAGIVEGPAFQIRWAGGLHRGADIPMGGCDRTTSEMRGLSLKIILGDSRRSENAQTHTHKHTIPNMKFKLKLLQINCHVLGFTKDKTQNVLQKIIRVFMKAFVSHDRHTLFALEESEPPRTIYTCESQ